MATRRIKKVFPKRLKGYLVGKGQWKLTHTFIYDNEPIYISVPRGFVTDGASIPRIVWTLIGSPWSGRYARAAVIHDFLYHIQTTTRWEADRIFYQAMKILKVSPWRRSLMHCSVRVAGWIPWRNYRRK